MTKFALQPDHELRFTVVDGVLRGDFYDKDGNKRGVNPVLGETVELSIAPPRTKSPMEQVLDAVPDEHRAIVGLHTNLIMNTSAGWRPSDAARRAVAEYERLGYEAFVHAHNADKQSALESCPCEACQRDAAKNR